jgi:hypothetical protein
VVSKMLEQVGCTVELQVLDAVTFNNSIVVIWIGHTGSYEDHAPLLGK